MKSLAGFGAEPQEKRRVFRGRAPKPSESPRRAAGGIQNQILNKKLMFLRGFCKNYGLKIVDNAEVYNIISIIGILCG